MPTPARWAFREQDEETSRVGGRDCNKERSIWTVRAGPRSGDVFCPETPSWKCHRRNKTAKFDGTIPRLCLPIFVFLNATRTEKNSFHNFVTKHGLTQTDGDFFVVCPCFQMLFCPILWTPSIKCDEIGRGLHGANPQMVTLHRGISGACIAAVHQHQFEAGFLAVPNCDNLLENTCTQSK